jgi:hypothetical protein
LFLSAPGTSAGKVMTMDNRGHLLRGKLADNLGKVITDHKIDIVSLDPFVKCHSCEENNNSAIDDVVQVLTDLAAGTTLLSTRLTTRRRAPSIPEMPTRGVARAP